MEQEVCPLLSQIYQLAVERNEGGTTKITGRPQTNSPRAKLRGGGKWEVLSPSQPVHQTLLGAASGLTLISQTLSLGYEQTPCHTGKSLADAKMIDS